MSDLTIDEIFKRYPVGTVLKLTATVTQMETPGYGGTWPVEVQYLGTDNTGWLTAEMVAAAEIVSRPIKAGGKVHDTSEPTFGDGSRPTYTVIHVEGDRAWLSTEVTDKLALVSNLEAA